MVSPISDSRSSIARPRPCFYIWLWRLVAFWIGGARAGEDGANETVAAKQIAEPASAGAAQRPSPELMLALMAWAAPRLDLPVPAVMPRIVRKGRCELNAIASGIDRCPDARDGIQAMYASNVMWLNDDWRGDNIRDISILLHELVHHMQHHAGVPASPCQAEALEKPAYEVQFAFLEAAGVDPYEVVGINDLMLIVVTNCLGRH